MGYLFKALEKVRWKNVGKGWS